MVLSRGDIRPGGSLLVSATGVLRWVSEGEVRSGGYKDAWPGVEVPVRDCDRGKSEKQSFDTRKILNQ